MIVVTHRVASVRRTATGSSTSRTARSEQQGRSTRCAHRCPSSTSPARLRPLDEPNDANGDAQLEACTGSCAVPRPVGTGARPSARSAASWQRAAFAGGLAVPRADARCDRVLPCPPGRLAARAAAAGARSARGIDPDHLQPDRRAWRLQSLAERPPARCSLAAASLPGDSHRLDSRPSRALGPSAGGRGSTASLMLLLLAVHLSVSDFAKTGQRFELFLLPLIVGAFAALTGRHIGLLKAYVLVGDGAGRRVAPCAQPGPEEPGRSDDRERDPRARRRAGAPPLPAVRARSSCPASSSPGAAGRFSRRRRPRGDLCASGLSCAGRPLRPPLDRRAARDWSVRRPSVSLEARLTTFSAGVGSPGSYALHLRQQYANAAEQIIRAHPYVGIGVGNYLAGSPYNGTQSQDPHDVLLLQAAEGGYLFAASFVLLIAGCALALRKMRQVDVAPRPPGYCSRRSPTARSTSTGFAVRRCLSWLLVGMACGGFVKLREAAAADGEAMMRPVRVVVVAYGAPEQLDRCLAGLGDELEATVVDNSSSPTVASVAERRGADYVVPGRNLGFAAGVNLALEVLLADHPGTFCCSTPTRFLAFGRSASSRSISIGRGTDVSRPWLPVLPDLTGARSGSCGRSRLRCGPGSRQSVSGGSVRDISS